jgi:formylmethanofuran:tetrahydromethanopterin formyltransferase
MLKESHLGQIQADINKVFERVINGMASAKVKERYRRILELV